MIASSDSKGNTDHQSDPRDQGEERTCRWQGNKLVLEIKSPGKGGFTFDLLPSGQDFQGGAKIKITQLPIASVRAGSVKLIRLQASAIVPKS
jgi:hypothetical protein